MAEPVTLAFEVGRGEAQVAELSSALRTRGTRVVAWEVSTGYSGSPGTVVVRAKSAAAVDAVRRSRPARCFPPLDAIDAMRVRSDVHARLRAAGVEVPEALVVDDLESARRLDWGPSVFKPLSEHGAGVWSVRRTARAAAGPSGPVWVERRVEGRHATVYFIGGVCLEAAKVPFAGDANEGPLATSGETVRVVVDRVRAALGLRWGKIDMVRSGNTIAVVDVGGFPSFRQFPHAVERIAEQVLAASGTG